MKKILSLITLMMLCVVSVNAKTVYLSPGVWAVDDARFAVYMYQGEENAWADFTAVEEVEGIYSAAVPETYENIILVRLDGKTTENSWDNKWDQTADITSFADGALFTITAFGEKAGDVSTYSLAEYHAPIIPAGTYYVLNAAYDEPQVLMAAGHSWGTRGIVNEKGLDLDFIYDVPTGTYTIDSRVSNGGTNHYLNSNLYMDSQPFGWTIEGEFVYTIGAVIDGVKKYLAVDSNLELVLTEDATVDNAQWAFLMKDYWENNVIKANGLESLKAATADNPVDATFLIKTPDFNRNDQRNAQNWTMEASNQNLGGGGSDGNGCAESWHSVFTLSQTLADAPAGVYSFTAQGFYRQDGSDNDNLPFFYANDEKQTFPLLTGTENSMADAGVSFTAGKYAIDPIFVQVAEDGALTIGAKLETNTALWCIWDNFQLKYYGSDASLEQIKNAALFAQVEELRAKAQQLAAEAEVEAVKQALNAAVEATADVTTVEAANAAVETLNAAIDKAEASAIAKDVLAQMKKLTESTNFYTEAAYEEYYGQWAQKYEEGTLTKAEANALQNPYTVTGWRASNTVDDLLMSTWDAEPMAWDQYYINTWSVEGATDGTDFEVPFFEYWTGDANSLGKKVLTGTMSGLEPGTYGVSAWVRVRGKNDFTRPAYGITMDVNGTQVDATATTEVSGTNFYVGQVNAIGEVGEDGVLTLKFNVAEDNNISWLSFKNVKYNKMQTFTAKFENEDTWEKVYAYTWTGGEYDKVEQLGAWPGTEITATVDEAGVYTATIAAMEAPANIIFNNGEGVQTEDFEFVDGQTYKYILPATDIEITVESGDIAEALNAAKAEVAKVGQIIINLKEAEYTVSSTLEAPAALYINGNGATIDASALEAPFITMSATPTVEENNTYYRVGIGINDLTLNGLKNSIFYDNNVKYCATGFYISNCVMQLATEAVANEALISFKGGGAKDFYVTNSTIYGNADVAKYFVRYNNSARLDRYGYDKNTEFESVNYVNNTFYNLLKSDGQWANYSGMAGQKYTAFDVKNNIWMNCGENLIARRLLGGRQASSYTNCTFENNTYAHVDAESGEVVFETEGTVGTDEETGEATNVGSYDVSGTALTTDPNFKDAENSDFAVEATTDQALKQTGDLRWGTWTAPVIVEAGYYLVGSMNDWKPSAEYLFEANEGAEGEYMFTTDLEAGAEFKVIFVNEEQTWTWYPAEGANYSVNDAGNYIVYFRPEFNTEWNSHVYIVKNTTDGINAAKVVSLNGAEVYNLNGQRVQNAQKGLYIINGKKVVLK